MSFPAPLLILLLLVGSASALGGYRHRNRQNPSAYFSWGYGPSQREFAENDDRRPQDDILDVLLTETEASPEEGSCLGKRCTVNEKCCPGAVCVDMDGLNRVCGASVIADAGTCLPTYGARQGEVCLQDSDCVPGLFCSESEDNAGLIVRMCHAERRTFPRKQYNDRCETSHECNLEKGMCCQLQRRHRQAPKKVCVYYKDPNDCIGNVGDRSKFPLLEGTKSGPVINGRIG